MAEAYQELLEQAVRAGESRNYKESVRLLRKILEETDSLPQARLYLGRSYHAIGDYGAAVRELRQFIRDCPDCSAGYFFLGRTYGTLGIFDFAIPWLKKALILDSGNPHIRPYLGLLYLKARIPDSAVHHLEKAVLLAPNNKYIYTAYVNALSVSAIRTFYRGDLDMAGQIFRFVLKNGNRNQFVHVYLAEIEFELGNLEESLRQYENALSFNPEDPFLVFRHARVRLLPCPATVIAHRHAADIAVEMPAAEHLGTRKVMAAAPDRPGAIFDLRVKRHPVAGVDPAARCAIFG